MDLHVKTENFFNNVAPVRSKYLNSEECAKIDKFFESKDKKQNGVFFMQIDTIDYIEAKIIFDALDTANGKLLAEDEKYAMDSVPGSDKNQKVSYFNVTLAKDQEFFPHSTVLLSVPNMSVKVNSDDVEGRLLQLVDEVNRTLLVPRFKGIGRQIVLPANISRSN
jgi:hypothetical protein